MQLIITHDYSIKRCRETKGDRKDDEDVIDRLGQQVMQIKLSGWTLMQYSGVKGQFEVAQSQPLSGFDSENEMRAKQISLSLHRLF